MRLVRVKDDGAGDMVGSRDMGTRHKTHELLATLRPLLPAAYRVTLSLCRSGLGDRRSSCCPPAPYWHIPPTLELRTLFAFSAASLAGQDRQAFIRLLTLYHILSEARADELEFPAAFKSVPGYHVYFQPIQAQETQEITKHS